MGGKGWAGWSGVGGDWDNCNSIINKYIKKKKKNRIPPAPKVNLCSEMARSHVLWSVLPLNKSALSLSAINSMCSV